MSSILIAGGSGLVGTALASHLKKEGHDVAVLSRSVSPKANIKTFSWDPSSQLMDEAACLETEVIINLAGASVSGKLWTKKYKQELIDSRLQSTSTLLKYMPKMPKLKKFISASAIGYYPNGGNTMDESSAQGQGFLAKLCSDWEAEALKAPVDTAIVRIGIVLSDKGGFLEAMSKPIKLGAGAVLGSGKQMISWIDIRDLTQLFDRLCQNGTGIFNGVSGQFTTNKTMTKTIAKQLKRPVWLPPVPAFALKLIFGDFSDELLADHKVISVRGAEIGWQANHTDLSVVLSDLL
ncbi:MAG: TIGR01777 family protein [Bacteroidetes bacterium]|nr:MAG: TIGR01777 family protein [Bacteroidota bacterium]